MTPAHLTITRRWTGPPRMYKVIFPATTATGAVVYSMGNLLTNESKEICKHSGILQLKLK